MSILIKKSPTADTRTCDYENVSKDTLIESTVLHIKDVRKGIGAVVDMLLDRAMQHDHTKLSKIDMFYADFQSGFRTQKWFALHKRKERHHLGTEDGVPEDVNLIDIIEYVVDGVMAGMARSGKYEYRDEIDASTLCKAMRNTATMISDMVIVDSGDNDA